MNRFVFALAVTLVLGMVGVSRAQCGCQLNDYTPGHTAGSYWTTGCCRYRDCPISCGQVAPSFPPGPGPLTITMPGLMPPTLIVSPPMPSPPPSSEAQPAPPAAASITPATPPATKSADRGSARVMGNQTRLN